MIFAFGNLKKFKSNSNVTGFPLEREFTRVAKRVKFVLLASTNTLLSHLSSFCLSWFSTMSFNQIVSLYSYGKI
jgi:hypothetical protein